MPVIIIIFLFFLCKSHCPAFYLEKGFSRRKYFPHDNDNHVDIGTVFRKGRLKMLFNHLVSDLLTFLYFESCYNNFRCSIIVVK